MTKPISHVKSERSRVASPTQTFGFEIHDYDTVWIYAYERIYVYERVAG